MIPGFFITGTDTGVGKTVLSAILVAALEGVYWKPVQSGASEGTDRRAVMEWAALPETRTLPESYCFDPPLPPHLAARLGGTEIELSRIRLPEPGAPGPLIAEGAGGVLTPLTGTETILDLIRCLGLPVIVASRTSLGTINHTLLTLGALREAGVSVRGVVMIGEENAENRRAIEHYGRVSVVGHVPTLPILRRDVLLEIFHSRFQKSYFTE
jgi:dethiobiotin synthetase